MPNYSKQIESYRCGDLFTFKRNKSIYILSQTNSGRGKLIGLYDCSNRIASCCSYGERDTAFIGGLSRVSKEELNEIASDAVNCFGEIECIGNIKDFKLFHKGTGKVYDNLVDVI